MKHLFIPLLFICLSLGSFAQADTLPPYKQVPVVPPFSISLADGTTFTKADLEKKPTLILYFSPNCGHCQLETEEIIARNKALGKLQIVMITSRPVEDMKSFADKYMLHKFANIKIGSDLNRFVTQFYKVKFTPFSALYNKKGDLVKVYESGIDYDDLLANTK